MKTLNPPSKLNINWLPSGKPVVEGLPKQKIDVSLTHDEQFCLYVSGYGSQGCDILPITHRSEKDWIALLSFKRENLLNELVSRTSDSFDIAGSRIWTAIEALRKATNIQEVELFIESFEGDSVLFKGIAADKQLFILTFPITLSRSSQRMVAFIVKKTDEEKSNLNRFTNPQSIYQIKEQNPFVVRWPVSYQDTANLSQSIYFSRFFSWMGKLRDLSIWSIRDTLGEYLATGKCGMVTNFANTQIFGEAGINDVIEARFWVTNISGTMASTVDFYCDWFKVSAQETCEQIATSTLRMTWVNFGESSAKPNSLPPFLASFIKSLHKPKSETEDKSKLWKRESLGKVIYDFCSQSLTGKKVHQLNFATTLEDTDAVGNINFANYAILQGRIRDSFLYGLMPENYRRSNNQGEFRCINSSVEYLREAFPFENIQVILSLRKIYEQGLSFGIEYFRLTKEGDKQKLALGKHDVIWLICEENQHYSPANLPQVLTEALILISDQLNSVQIGV